MSASRGLQAHRRRGDQAFGAVDALLNNAALRPNKPFLEMTEAEWRRVISVDLDAAVWLARACLPGMVQKGWGRIVNFTGMNAIHGHAGRTPVSVAKHGVWGLTKALAMEFGPKNITVNAISPGPIAPDSEEKNASAQAPRPDRGPRAARPHGQPVEVAAAARLLVSEAGRLHQRPDDPGERRRRDLTTAPCHSIGKPTVRAMRAPALDLAFHEIGEAARLCRSGSAPCSAQMCFTLGSASAACTAPCSVSRIAEGVALGANRPYQVLTVKSGTPAWRNVGTSGSTGSRLGAATASARRRPDCT
jgi:hypothetical protein